MFELHQLLTVHLLSGERKAELSHRRDVASIPPSALLAPLPIVLELTRRSALMSVNALNVMIRHDASLKYEAKRESIFEPPSQRSPAFAIIGGLEMCASLFSSKLPAQEIIGGEASGRPFDLRLASSSSTSTRSRCLSFAPATWPKSAPMSSRKCPLDAKLTPTCSRVFLLASTSSWVRLLSLLRRRVFRRPCTARVLKGVQVETIFTDPQIKGGKKVRSRLSAQNDLTLTPPQRFKVRSPSSFYIQIVLNGNRSRSTDSRALVNLSSASKTARRRPSKCALPPPTAFGRLTALQRWWKQAKNQTLRFPNLGIVRVTKTAWYPLELSVVLLSQNDADPRAAFKSSPATNSLVRLSSLLTAQRSRLAGKLSPDQVADILKFTTHKPAEKMNLIRQGLQSLGYTTNETVRAWGFEMSPNMLEAKGRILPAPTMKVGKCVAALSRRRFYLVHA